MRCVTFFKKVYVAHGIEGVSSRGVTDMIVFSESKQACGFVVCLGVACGVRCVHVCVCVCMCAVCLRGWDWCLCPIKGPMSRSNKSPVKL